MFSGQYNFLMNHLW